MFISVLLTGVYGAGPEVILLGLFGALVFGVTIATLRVRPPRLVRVVRETTHRTGLVAVRLAVLVMAAFVLFARDAGFDFVFGALAAGLFVGLVLDAPEGRLVRMRLEGIGFVVFIPIYFVVTGMNFDLDSLLSVYGLALAALFLGLLLVVRGVSSLLWLRDLRPRRTLGLGLFAATGLPLIVAIVGIGSSRGAISGGVGASLLGAGMLSVMIFPALGLRTTRPSGASSPDEPRAEARIASEL